MSWWNAKYKNDHGEYEITFASKYYDRTKAVEKFCQAIIDKKINCTAATAALDRIIKEGYAVEFGTCEGCAYRNRKRPQKCSCCRRNRYLKDCYVRDNNDE